MVDFLRVLSAQYGASVAWSEGVDKRLVSAEFQSVPLEDVFSSLARRFECEVTRVGNMWYVGTLKAADRAFFVRKMRRLDADGLVRAAQVVMSEAGRIQSFPDGLVVCSDRVEVLQRVSGVFDAVESARSDAWVCQLYLVSLSKTATKDLGVDTTALLDLSYTLAKASLTRSPRNGLHLASSLDLVLHATATRSDVSLVARPLFVLGDGESGAFTSGTKVPIPRKTVSDQGTVTTSGYDYVQSGTTAKVKLREYGQDSVRLEVNVTLGSITGYVQEAPIQQNDDFNTVAVLSSDGVYLLGSLDQDGTRDDLSGLSEKLQTRRNQSSSAGQVQVWARLYRVAGPVMRERSAVGVALTVGEAVELGGQKP